MSASQRTKGAAIEREIASRLAVALGRPVKRVLGQARDGGCDIVLPMIGGRRALIEVKARKAFAVQLFLDQVEAVCEPRDLPAVVLRQDRCEPLVLLRFEDYVELIRGELEP